jgi:3-deoxy-D-arabino-heptulosonate 7-phosphate (DAHP) synthase
LTALSINEPRKQFVAAFSCPLESKEKVNDFADSVVWFGRSNIYKNKEKTELLSKASLYCWTVSTVVSAIIEVCP